MNVRHSEPRSWWASLPWYLKARFLRSSDSLTRKIKGEGFGIRSSVPMFLDGGTPAVMAKSVGVGIIKIIDELQRLEPDLVFINADRFEMMAVAIAAAYLNIPIAHNEAGDVSGTIDESVRHAITKFAHIHFCATEKSQKRVLQMGENPEFVFTVGSPAIDALKNLEPEFPQKAIPLIDGKKPYLLVMSHPVTTESAVYNQKTLGSIAGALEKLSMPVIWIGGNSDAHSHIVGPGLAEWAEHSRHSWLYTAKWMHPDYYLRVLANAACAVGNSSSFIREGSYLGTPAVLVGSRQQGRDRGKNIIEIEADAEKIEKAVRFQISHGPYASDALFGDGDAGDKIAEILAAQNPPIQKKFYEL